MAKIGFVGLGHMGLPMAINLVKSGHQVTGFDLQANALEQFVMAGGHSASSLQETAREQDIVLTMLQTGQQVLDVCLNERGIFSGLHGNSLYIDCSTIDVDSSRKLHQEATTHQFLVVDAPVSGGVAGAAAATLTFMVGGTKKAFEAAEPILKCMGQKIIHTGDAGSGQVAKICNNLVLATSMTAVAEAFTLAKRLDLAPEKLFEVMNSSSGQCWALSKYIPVPGILEQVPANNEYQPGFAATMMLKDLLLSQSTADSIGLSTPLTAKTTMLYQQLVDEGYGQLDFSAIIKLLSSHKKV